jgi:hypothetical protein
VLELQKLANTVGCMHELRKEGEYKVDVCLVSTVAQVDELAAAVKRTEHRLSCNAIQGVGAQD